MPKLLKLYVELANTPSKREKGLMFRKSLEENYGMLFKFSSKQHMSFWMKNTYIPLDIAFLEDDGTIFQIEEMFPLSTKYISSNKPCRYALEVNKGWFSKNKIDEGCKISGVFFNFNNSPDEFKIAQVTPNLQNINLPNQPNQQKQEITIDLNFKEKIKYAEQRGLKLRIIYITKDGHYVGPRVLSPVPQDNYTYPFYSGAEEYFRGYDESPTINGPNYVVEGGHPKSFYFSGITSLDILDKNGNVLSLVQGQPVIEQVTPEIKENEIKQYFKKSIPNMSDAQWNEIKDNVLNNVKKGYDFSNIVNNVKNYFTSFFSRFKGKK